MNDDLKNISDLLAGKTSIKAEIDTMTIIYLSIGIFISVLLAVIIANELTK